MGLEQREFTRLLPKDNAFAVLGRDAAKVGRIKDISKGGSSFEYITNIDLRESTPKEIDIFLTGEEFYLADLACNIVYDVQINTGNIFSSPFITKRCGLKFGFLSENQMLLLEYFLKNHTFENSILSSPAPYSSSLHHT
ncbi:MAG: hypothetical protein WCQ99_02210 [Pseudomonadota bacterium]